MKKEERKKPEFDVKKIYYTDWTKKKLLKHISRVIDKKLQVIILPTSPTSADILIRDIRNRKDYKD